MSIPILVSTPFADVNASFAVGGWNFDRHDDRRAIEWADLDALPASDIVPMPVAGADLDPREAQQALQWVECLPREDRRRLVEIAAERLGIEGRDLPTFDELKAALDRPESPRGLAEWHGAIESASRRKGAISGGIHRWSQYMVDREQEYLEQRAEWLAVARWHRLAVEVCRLMRDLHPVEGDPAVRERGAALWDVVSPMSPRGRGTRLMDVPEAEVCEIAREIGDRRMALLETRRAAGIVDGDLTPDDRRDICPIHWRRVLRREARTARQYWQAALGLAWHGGAKYCADRTLSRFQERQAADAAFAAAQQMMGPDGAAVELSKIKDASDRAKIARLFVNVKGMEDLAQRAGLKALFLTLNLVFGLSLRLLWRILEEGGQQFVQRLTRIFM